MKGNLHGYLLAVVMIAIAVGGTAHHLGKPGARPVGAEPDATLRNGVGLLQRETAPADDGPHEAGAEPCQAGAREIAGPADACRDAAALARVSGDGQVTPPASTPEPGASPSAPRAPALQ